MGAGGGGSNPAIPVNNPGNPGTSPGNPPGPGQEDCGWMPVWKCRHIHFPKSGYQEIICDPGWAWLCPGDEILASASGGAAGPAVAACAVPGGDGTGIM